MRKVISTLILCFFPALLWALALGPIKVSSYLDQPFNAEVPLQSLGDTSLENIKVGLASKDAYDVNHLRYSDTVSGLRFKVGNNREGMPVLHIYSQDPIHDPYLNFILSYSWPNGFLNQQYTVLLDPPELKTQPRPAKALNKAPILANQSPVPPGTYAGIYGPTTSQDTLWSIASTIKPDRSVTRSQVELALYQANPNVFIDQDINRLMLGYTLQVPTIKQIKSTDPKKAALMIDELLQGSERIQAKTSTPLKQTQIEQPPTPVALNRPVVEAVAVDTTPPPLKQAIANATGTANALTSGVQRSNMPVASTLVLGDGSAPPEMTSPTNNTLPENVPPQEWQAMETALTLSNQALSSLKESNGILTYQLQQIQQQNQNLQVIIQNQENQINELRRELIQLQPAAPKSTIAPQPSSTTPSTPASTTTEKVSVPAQLPASTLKKLPTSQPSNSFPTLLTLLALACIAFAVVFYLRWRKEHHVEPIEDDKDFPRAPVELPNFKSTTSAQDASPSQTPKAPGPITTLEPELQEPAQPSMDAEYSSSPNPLSAAVVTDPLEEAEVYIAYERYKPAESVLLAALTKTPQRTDLLDKLFELYTLIPNESAYQNAMQEYREQIKESDSNLWERILARHEAKWPTQVKKHDSEFAPPTSPSVPAKPLEPAKQPESNNLSGLKLAPRGGREEEPKEGTEPSSPLGFNTILEDSDVSPIAPKEEPVKAEDSSLIDTELDLIQTYLEMNDEASAKEALDRIMTKCNPKQQARANEFLQKIK